MGLLLFIIGLTIFFIGLIVLLQDQQRYVWAEPTQYSTINELDFEISEVDHD